MKVFDSVIRCWRCGSAMKMLVTGPASQPHTRATYFCSDEDCPDAR